MLADSSTVGLLQIAAATICSSSLDVVNQALLYFIFGLYPVWQELSQHSIQTKTNRHHDFSLLEKTIISTNTLEDYRKTIKYLEKKQMEFHASQLHSEKVFRTVIRPIHQ